MAANEQTPLVSSSSGPTEAASSPADYEFNQLERRSSIRHKATFDETVVNIMKTAMGTGCLALAFACQQGGLVLFCAGLAALAAWNVYSVHRLVACLSYLPSSTQRGAPFSTATATSTVPVPAAVPSTNNDTVSRISSASHLSSADALLEAIEEDMDTVIAPSADSLHHDTTGSTMGLVAWHALGGTTGLATVDAMIFLYLLGIVVAYVSAVSTFIAATPASLSRILPGWSDAAVAGVIMATTSSAAPHVGFLSKASALGLAVLVLTFVIIAGYGVYETSFIDANSTTTTPSTAATVHNGGAFLNVWPASPFLAGVSHWFGVCVFGFGTVPLTYVFRSSMEEPRRAVEAHARALYLVTLLYTVLGVGLYYLFPQLTGDVLSELPKTGLLPTVCRIAMVIVILMTAPLLIVPCAELVEHRVIQPHHRRYRRLLVRVVTRFSVCAIAVLLAVALPGFVQVLSFVGCACVGAVSFILPPLLYIRLVRTSRKRSKRDTGPAWFLILDVVLLAWGVVATIISTWFSLNE